MTFEDIALIIKTQGIKLLYGLLVLVIGFFLVHWILKLVKKWSEKRNIDSTVKSFLIGLIRIVLYVMVILTAVGVMGIPLTSVITVIASAGVAVSLAMQGALSNLVGGLTLLILKPIKAGEFISVNGMDGTVNGIGVFYTDLITPDNKHICLPNSTLVNTAITNVTREGTRRVDVNFSVSYKAKITEVRRVLLNTALSCGTILPAPEPMVAMTGCEDSSVSVVLRVWCKSSDYITTLYYLLEEGKSALDAAGIEIPFPQMDVHIKDKPEAL